MFRARTTIERIDDALARIDDGSYAICESCARPIPFDHLEAIPHAGVCRVRSSSVARSSFARHIEVGESNRNHRVKRLVTTTSSSATGEP